MFDRLAFGIDEDGNGSYSEPTLTSIMRLQYAQMALRIFLCGYGTLYYCPYQPLIYQVEFWTFFVFTVTPNDHLLLVLNEI